MKPYHIKLCCQKALAVVAGRRGQKRSLLKVNEHFALKPDAVNNTLSHQRAQFCCQKALDVVAGRRGQKRSLLKVNEHFALKPDAADDALSQQITRRDALSSPPTH